MKILTATALFLLAFVTMPALSASSTAETPVPFETPAVKAMKARALIQNSWAEQTQGQFLKARDLGISALDLALAIGDSELVWSSRVSLFSAYSRISSIQDIPLAIQYGSQALEDFHAASVASLGLYQSPHGTDTLLNAEVYENLASALINTGRFDEAEQVLGMLKEKELVELLRSSNMSTRRQLRDAFSAVSNSRRVYRLIEKYDQRAVAVHYAMSETQLSILVSTPHERVARQYPISRIELQKLMAALRTSIVNRLDTRKQAQRLWEVLVGPIQDVLDRENPQTLVLNLTGRMRYLPFAALQNPKGGYLVEQYALVNWVVAGEPSLERSDGPLQIDALGVTQAKAGQSALPNVKTELVSLVRNRESPKGLLPGRLALDEQFTLSRFEEALIGQSNVVHVATHFEFKPGDEHGSSLLLGTGDGLSLSQLGKYDYSKLELITLSACNTATGGGVNEHGIEVEGLAASMLKNNAQTVLASLWKVSDDSTAKLMQGFYSARTGKSAMGRAAALRQAQVQLLKGPNRQYSHPFFWAPFVLSGNWL